jgi:hypothetical protein
MCCTAADDCIYQSSLTLSCSADLFESGADTVDDFEEFRWTASSPVFRGYFLFPCPLDAGAGGSFLHRGWLSLRLNPPLPSLELLTLALEQEAIRIALFVCAVSAWSLVRNPSRSRRCLMLLDNCI